MFDDDNYAVVWVSDLEDPTAFRTILKFYSNDSQSSHYSGLVSNSSRAEYYPTTEFLTDSNELLVVFCKQPSTYFNIYAFRYDVSSRQWGDKIDSYQVNIEIVTKSFFVSVIAYNEISKTHMIIYNEGPASNIWGVVYDENFNRVTNEMQIASDRTGFGGHNIFPFKLGFIFVYDEPCTINCDSRIMGQKYDFYGNKIDNEFVIYDSKKASYFDENPFGVAFDDGSFIVAWRQRSSDGFDQMVRYFPGNCNISADGNECLNCYGSFKGEYCNECELDGYDKEDNCNSCINKNYKIEKKCKKDSSLSALEDSLLVVGIVEGSILIILLIGVILLVITIVILIIYIYKMKNKKIGVSNNMKELKEVEIKDENIKTNEKVDMEKED